MFFQMISISILLFFPVADVVDVGSLPPAITDRGYNFNPISDSINTLTASETGNESILLLFNFLLKISKEFLAAIRT